MDNLLLVCFSILIGFLISNFLRLRREIKEDKRKFDEEMTEISHQTEALKKIARAFKKDNEGNQPK